MRGDWRRHTNRFAGKQTLRRGRSVAGIEKCARNRHCIFHRARRGATRIGTRHNWRLPAASLARAGITQIRREMFDLFDFLKRARLIKRGLASRKTRRRRLRSELLRNLEYAPYAKF